MLLQIRRSGAIVALGVLTLAVALGAGAGPEDTKRAADPISGPGPLYIPVEEPHRPAQLGARVSPSDGRPVAYLSNATSDFATMEVSIPKALEYRTLPHYTSIADEESIEMFGSIRYETGRHTVMVTTARPGPRAYQTGWPLGDQKVELPDGTTGWITLTTRSTPDTPHRLVFERDGLLISVFSDLPADALIGLAARVSMTR